ncbi:MAG: hypothetical protein HY928_16485 [Elusimicrobia bacterium]|nr:hypothetical protein [Elusimicrobiota bacterium]
MTGGRRGAFEGEARANLLRAAAITAFYLIELSDFRSGAVDRGFHLAMSALAGSWLITSWGVYVFQRRRFFPPALMYLSAGLDAAYLTAVLLVADGPRSPLAVALLLLPTLAALRLSLPLVRFATAGAALGYLVVLGHTALYRPGLAVPRGHQLVFLAALVLSGVMVGQVLRRARTEPS